MQLIESKGEGSGLGGKSTLEEAEWNAEQVLRRNLNGALALHHFYASFKENLKHKILPKYSKTRTRRFTGQNVLVTN